MKNRTVSGIATDKHANTAASVMWIGIILCFTPLIPIGLILIGSSFVINEQVIIMCNQIKRLTEAEAQAVRKEIARLEKFSSDYATEMLGHYKKLLKIYG